MLDYPAVTGHTAYQVSAAAEHRHGHLSNDNKTAIFGAALGAAGWRSAGASRVGCKGRREKMKYLFSAALIATIGMALSVSTSEGTVYLNEQFAYSDGNLTALGGGANVSGGNWTTLSGTGTPLVVNSQQIAGLAHGGGSREDATRIFNATNITTGSVYAGLFFTVTTAPTGGTDYFFALHGIGDSNFRSRSFLSGPATAGAGRFRIGLDGDATAPVFSSDLIANTLYALIIGYDNATGAASMWVGDANTFTFASPTLTDTSAVATGLARVVLRQGATMTLANSINIDSVVVTSTFAEALASIPEPSAYLFGALATMLGGGAAFGRRMFARS